ncbi:MAG: hypothetical protein HOP03_15910 [Lysobacter sp.]|nr:hypothetical protein [Lysobacter sp.]
MHSNFRATGRSGRKHHEKQLFAIRTPHPDAAHEVLFDLMPMRATPPTIRACRHDRRRIDRSRVFSRLRCGSGRIESFFTRWVDFHLIGRTETPTMAGRSQ